MNRVEIYINPAGEMFIETPEIAYRHTKWQWLNKANPPYWKSEDYNVPGTANYIHTIEYNGIHTLIILNEIKSITTT